MKLSHDYNEDINHMFYYDLHDKYGSSFKFTICNIIYEFTGDLWRSLFGIIIVGADAEPLVTDVNFHHDFKWNIHLNEILKAPRSDD